KEDPCKNVQCNYGAICVSSKDGKSSRCQCQERCDSYGDNVGNTPICGNDKIDYNNFCELQRASCKKMEEIKVKYYGKCDPCDGFECTDGQTCQLNSERQPVCRCDADCGDMVAPVCGSDGQTYNNECLMKREACKSRREITVRYMGECSAEDNLCETMECGPNRDCTIDRKGRAVCMCPVPCEQIKKPVCGSDGQTYENECELRKYACEHDIEIRIVHSGKCETNILCKSVICGAGAECVVHKGQPVCECPACTEEYDPVCGKDGMSYMNLCKFKHENCMKNRSIEIEYRGLCVSNSCQKNKTICQYYSVCQFDGDMSRCVCPSDCLPVDAKVCGSDGMTYQNECELRVASCMMQKTILMVSVGQCEDCSGVRCKNGARCEKGMCVCPVHCPLVSEPVCASNGVDYKSECEMQKEACRTGRELSIAYSGECSDMIDSGSGDLASGSGSGSGTGSGSDGMVVCEESMCKFGGTCYLGDDGLFSCRCSFICDAIRSPVCGSDGITYGNECLLRVAACDRQIEITVTSQESCDGMSHELCDGEPALIDPRTNTDYRCSAGHHCPGHSYCHLQFGKCCSEAHLSDGVTDCSETTYGCCSDGFTIALGPLQGGCPDECQCNSMGSLGTSCDSITKQCKCKAGVGGQQCDRCLPGYWGLHLIQEKQNSGCMQCGCHKIGSQRDDCQQMTGRCVCKSGYNGTKCDRCEKTNKRISEHVSCDTGLSCEELDCQFGATCAKYWDTAKCVCDIKCNNNERAETVCGSNGETYDSICLLRKASCLIQVEITVVHQGPCRGEILSTKGITPPALTTKSRKTTRHIHTKPSSNSTQKPPINKPKQPNFNYGRIGDLCLDDVDDSSSMRCYIANSVCQFGLCHCMEGYIPTYENTQCSAVHVDPSENTVAINADVNACTLNPCLNRGICQLDHSLGYRCLCAIGRSGSICKQEISFMYPSFSGLSFLSLTPIGNITDHFTLEIAFHSMNKDGVILFASENKDGTGQFISLAISNGQVELRFDMGEGPVIAHHPHEISLDSYHHVIIRLQGHDGILIQDNTEPVKVSQASSFKVLDLSGALYLGYIPQNLSYVLEKVGVNLGFVGCIQSLAAGRTELAKIYNMEYPNVYTDIKDGIHITPCGRNPCQSLPCTNGGTCIMKDADLFECTCPKGFTGDTCETALDVCTNNPCHHGATCSVTDEGEVICYCPEGREGQYCEYEKLERVFVPYFKGDSFMILPVEKVAKQMSIEVWFLTSQPNGMLLFASQYDGLGDFISLNIVERHVEFHFDLGSGPVKIRSSKAVTLNKWHRVMVHRMNREADLILDGGKPDKGISQQSDFMELQLSEKVYLGGYKDRFSIPVDSGITSNLTGAIQRLYINHLFDDLMNSVIETWHIEEYKGQPCNVNPCLNGGVCVPRLEYADCRCPKRYIGERCEKRADSVNTNSPVMFNGKTYLKYNNEVEMTQPAQKDNKFKLQFKTVEKNGLLLFQSSGPSILGDYLSLSVVNGRVEFSYNLGKQSEINIFKLRSTLDVGDGVWHTVIAYREKRHGSLQVDQEQPIVGDSDNGATQLDTEGILWIGGKADMPWGLPPEYYTGFKGCIGQVQINNVDLHLFEHRDGQSNTIVEFCD
ncbi:hypothetical protein ACJMK2_007067, partial [Sinanodonta woodiana]